MTIKTKDIHPSEFNKMLLIQLAIDSDVLDYSLINYEPPDFWEKQINRNQKLPRWFKIR